MRRKDKERDAAFAWQVLRDAPYAVVAMTDGDGTPYCVPVNHIADEAGNAIYFHCAGAGIVPGKLTTAYDSAIVHGRAVVVQSGEEKMYALRLLVQALDPVSMERAHMCSRQSMERTMIVKLVPEVVSGKQSHGD